MTSTDKWSDSFLDTLRSKGDVLADETLKLILKDNENAGISALSGPWTRMMTSLRPTNSPFLRSFSG